MTPSTPAPSISPPSGQPGSPQQPIYGGTTTKGRISMTNGHQLTSATRHHDHTIMVCAIPAPLARLRFAVYRRPLLRGLLLPPAQNADTFVLLALERTHQPTSHTHGWRQARRELLRKRLDDPGWRTHTATMLALRLLLTSVAATQLTLSGAAALGRVWSWLPQVVAALGFGVRPLLRWRIVHHGRSDDELQALHGAEHQALNCVRQGLALTDANIATSPVTSPTCDTNLRLTDQLLMVPLAVVLQWWLPWWPRWQQLLAGIAFYLVVRPLAFELTGLQVAWRARGRRDGVLGVLGRLGARRQAKVTLGPGEPAHRELAARALQPLLPAAQQALVGSFPSPVQTITSLNGPKEAVW